MPLIQVKSDIAGTVWKVEAAAGTSVEEDDTILLLESMKMEIPVAAPEAGKIKEIKVDEGDLVTEGQIVATMEV